MKVRKNAKTRQSISIKIHTSIINMLKKNSLWHLHAIETDFAEEIECKGASVMVVYTPVYVGRSQQRGEICTWYFNSSVKALIA